jgi:ketosteroid isomerase-like protein
VGCERGGAELKLAIRTSRIFKRIDGRWRQVHHHGSFDDPAFIASYQSMILRVSG